MHVCWVDDVGWMLVHVGDPSGVWWWGGRRAQDKRHATAVRTDTGRQAARAPPSVKCVATTCIQCHPVVVFAGQFGRDGVSNLRCWLLLRDINARDTGLWSPLTHIVITCKQVRAAPPTPLLLPQVACPAGRYGAVTGLVTAVGHATPQNSWEGLLKFSCRFARAPVSGGTAAILRARAR